MEMEKIRDAKKFALEYKINALMQIILLRYESLTTLSTTCFTVVGILLAIRPELFANRLLSYVSCFIFIIIAFISFGRFLYLTRKDAEATALSIKELPDADWTKPLSENGFSIDYYPEILFVLLIVTILLTAISMINFFPINCFNHLILGAFIYYNF